MFDRLNFLQQKLKHLHSYKTTHHYSDLKSDLLVLNQTNVLVQQSNNFLTMTLNVLCFPLVRNVFITYDY